MNRRSTNAPPSVRGPVLVASAVMLCVGVLLGTIETSEDVEQHQQKVTECVQGGVA